MIMDVPGAGFGEAEELQPLSSVAAGTNVTVRHLVDNPSTLRLREMGVVSGKSVRVLLAGDPLLCQVDETRIGLGRRLARFVYVVATQ